MLLQQDLHFFVQPTELAPRLLILVFQFFFHADVAVAYLGSLEMALQILSIHIFAALSPFCLESAVQLSIIGIENLRPSGSSLSGLPIRIGRIPGCPCSLSSALSTARFVCDVSRILHSGFRLIDCQIISAITVVLPVPGGPCIKAKSLARTDLATASICLSFGTGLDMQFS